MRILPLFIAAVGSAGCVAATGPIDEGEAPSGGEPELAEETGLESEEIEVAGTEQALFGPVYTNNCSENQKDHVRQIMIAGRTMANSPAFRECLNKAMRQTVGDYGPYLPCHPWTDPWASGTIDQQVTAALNATRSPNNTAIECSVTDRADVANAGPAGFPEYVEAYVWQGEPEGWSFESYAKRAMMIWHEVMHQWGYGHRDAPTGCQSWNTSVPYIVQYCMRDVIDASEEHCGGGVCEGARVPVVSNFPVTSSTGCHCVRDSAPGFPHSPVLGTSADGDKYGASFAVGDFNGDGLDDLAVGAYADQGKGAVYLYHGTAFGLYPWAVLTSSVANSDFGRALAAGDLNLDGLDDLAVGQPGDGAGAVLLYKGSRTQPPQLAGTIRQDGLGANETGDRFGAAVAIGFVFGAGHPGLVVGAPGEDMDGVSDVGAAFVFEGNTNALPVVPRYLLRQKPKDTETAGDQFGAAITTGFVDPGLIASVVVGAPGDRQNIGRAFVFTADSRAATSSPPRYMLVPPAGLGGFYGFSLAVAAVGVNGSRVIAVGAPWANGYNGAVYLHSGYATNGRLEQTLSASSSGELMGSSLARVRLKSEEAGDQLVVGSPGTAGGRLKRFKPSATGAVLTATHSQAGFGADESGDLFGWAVAVGDFNYDGDYDLVVGAMGEKPGARPAGGAAFHLNGDGAGIFTPFRTYFQEN